MWKYCWRGFISVVTPWRVHSCLGRMPSYNGHPGITHSNWTSNWISSWNKSSREVEKWWIRIISDTIQLKSDSCLFFLGHWSGRLGSLAKLPSCNFLDACPREDMWRGKCVLLLSIQKILPFLIGSNPPPNSSEPTRACHNLMICLLGNEVDRWCIFLETRLPGQ